MKRFFFLLTLAPMLAYAGGVSVSATAQQTITYAGFHWGDSSASVAAKLKSGGFTIVNPRMFSQCPHEGECDVVFNGVGVEYGSGKFKDDKLESVFIIVFDSGSKVLASLKSKYGKPVVSQGQKNDGPTYTWASASGDRLTYQDMRINYFSSGYVRRTDPNTALKNF